MSSSKSKYHFYLQECDKYGNVNSSSSSVKDIEYDFEGLRYAKMEGIEDIGEPKNVYTEEYADSERIRVHFPDKVLYKNTVIKFTCYIFGENRYNVYNSFNEYITKGFHRYWDTARKRYFSFYVKNSIAPTEEIWNGAGYLSVTYELNNIFGRTYPVD